MMRILFVGESWQGSFARTMREALAQQPNVVVGEVAEDQFLPIYRGVTLRIANRLLLPLQLRELRNAVLLAMKGFRPDVVLVYKGVGIGSDLIEEIRCSGVLVINVFPDFSPHAHGRRLQDAMGHYDLVISTKPFHPQLWQSAYGYRNLCVCVPHGYDPELNFWDDASMTTDFDIALCGTWRPEYHRLMSSFAQAVAGNDFSVAIAGHGWDAHRKQFPPHWHFVGAKLGWAYGEFLRSAKIAIAPVNPDIVVRGVKQHGDVDTTRTYELAAAYCFFLHQRTDYVATVYDEQNEVPLWSDAAELASLVRRWLPDEAGRRLMANRAHARAVPAYAVPQRAASIVKHIGMLINAHKDAR